MFNIGDIVKRPNGKMLYEVISYVKNRRFGEYYIQNRMTGKSYFSDLDAMQGWEIYNPFKPKLKKRIFKF